MQTHFPCRTQQYNIRIKSENLISGPRENTNKTCNVNKGPCVCIIKSCTLDRQYFMYRLLLNYTDQIVVHSSFGERI